MGIIGFLKLPSDFFNCAYRKGYRKIYRETKRRGGTKGIKWELGFLD